MVKFRTSPGGGAGQMFTLVMTYGLPEFGSSPVFPGHVLLSALCPQLGVAMCSRLGIVSLSEGFQTDSKAYNGVPAKMAEVHCSK